MAQIYFLWVNSSRLIPWGFIQNICYAQSSGFWIKCSFFKEGGSDAQCKKKNKLYCFSRF